MKRMNIQITEVEDKVSKDGEKTYTRFKTNIGWLSAFEEEMIAAIKANKDKILILEVSEPNDRGYQNIRGYMGLAKDQHKECVVEEIQIASKKTMNLPETNEFTGKPKYVGRNEQKNTTMYTSYAKDIFCAMLSKQNTNISPTMKVAIQLVKQAKEAFE